MAAGTSGSSETGDSGETGFPVVANFIGSSSSSSSIRSTSSDFSASKAVQIYWTMGNHLTSFFLPYII